MLCRKYFISHWKRVFKRQKMNITKKNAKLIYAGQYNLFKGQKKKVQFGSSFWRPIFQLSFQQMLAF